MARPRRSRAGCVISRARSSRSSRSTARTSDAPSVGSRNRTCSCARVTVAPTMRTARAPPDRRTVACSNIATRSKREISSSKPARSRRQGASLPSPRRSHRAPDRERERLARSAPAARRVDPGDDGAPGAPRDVELVLRLRQRRAHSLRPPDRHRHPARPRVRAVRGRGLEQPADPESRRFPRLVHSRGARMGIELHDRHRAHPYGAGLPVRGAQVSERADVDRRRPAASDDARNGVHGAGASLRPGRVLGTRDRCVDREPRAGHGALAREPLARRSDHRGRDAVALLRAARVRRPRAADRLRGSPPDPRAGTRDQRMADAGTRRAPRDVPGGVSPADARSGRDPVRAGGRMEGHLLLGLHPPVDRRVCGHPRPLRALRFPRPDDHPDRAASRLLLPVALRRAVAAAAVARDARVADRTGDRAARAPGASVRLRRGREELAAAPDRGADHLAAGGRARELHEPVRSCAVESCDGCVERRADSRALSEGAHRARTTGSARLPGQAVPQLPCAGRARRPAWADARRRRRPADARSADPAGHPGRGKHARLWKESESCGDDRSRGVYRNAASRRTGAGTRCLAGGRIFPAAVDSRVASGTRPARGAGDARGDSRGAGLCARLGAPALPLQYGLPWRSARRAVQRLLRSPPARSLRRFLTRPLVCWLAPVAALIGWHVPAVFELGVRSRWWHDLQAASFLATGVLFWLPVVRWRAGVVSASPWLIPVYLFAATLPCDALSAFLVFCDRVVYPSYLSAPRLSSLAPLHDQEFAGALMWVSVTLIYLLPAVVITIELLSPPRTDARRPRPPPSVQKLEHEHAPGRGHEADLERIHGYGIAR